ncbi:unnamed protein product [Bursaphelenchus xylophilus]|uniref:Tripeptidyl-peptidase 2 n=1 Tax=Bursaphelenchus xylophilus TaxID=6326 RepID=A0A1I7SAH9_BURXY|nr:unnamed protein product [Bursaphelenchus xylophilus]CAG9079405.1 unnamed protein product [Bursaphelenchus xylophilus]
MSGDYDGEDEKWPFHQLIPKDIVGQPDFLAKNPEFDGRGTVIAILDMGVDLAAPGLQTTSNGLPKIIDAVNFTGSGDVITTEVRRIDETREILGLSGRKLKIPERWTNPSGEYRLGLKRLFELYPPELLTRIRDSRLENELIPRHAGLIAENLKKLNNHINAVGQSSKNLTDKWKRRDLEFQLEYLRGFGSKIDSGPALDCVVWHDGERWRACLDTTFRGDLAKFTPMTDFRHERQWGFLTAEDSLTYCLAIRNNGNLLEITTPSGSHGTHCAHIAAAFYPDQPECSGLAPGAQIVSIVIGDNRNRGRSLGQAFARAINYCAEIGVDLVNFSYGGAHSAVQPTGTLLEYLNKLIYDEGIAFFASAGNEGPALSSLCDPAAQTSAVISVGAILPEDATEVLYGTSEKRETCMLHFSSRGPTSDGRLGINFTAPGAAIAGMPLYSQNAAQCKNGTSMAAPNALGCAACLLSAAKSANIPMSPLKLKLAMENSARPLDSEKLTKLDYGNGIINLPGAFEALKKLESLPETLSDFVVTVGHVSSGGSDHEKKGIYIRDPYQLQHTTDYKVWIEPRFRNRKGDIVSKHKFQRQIRLESSAPYVKHTKNIHLANEHASFQVRVDPANLEAGRVHYTEIVGYDAGFKLSPRAGTSNAPPLFRVPITVIKPLELEKGENSLKTRFKLTAGQPERLFLQCPSNSTEVSVKIKSTNKRSTAKIYLNFAQKVAAQDEYELYTLEPLSEISVTKWVRDRSSLEFCALLEWSNFDRETEIEAEFTFLGYYVSISDMYSGPAVGEMTLCNELSHMTLKPSLIFDWLRRLELPRNFRIEPLDERVFFMDNVKMYALFLTYHIKSEVSSTFKFSLPGVADHYYGNQIECLTMQLFEHQKLIPPYSGREYRGLEKGDYRLEVQLRHKDTVFLEKFTSAPLEMRIKLKPITISIYHTYQAAQKKGNNTISSLAMRPGQTKTAFYSGTESLPTWSRNGDCLYGTMSLTATDPGQTVTMQLSAFPRAAMSKANRVVELKNRKDESKTPEMKFKDALRDFKISQMLQTSDEKISESLYKELSDEYPDNIVLLLARLSLQYSKKERNVKEIYELANKLIGLIGMEEVLKFTGNRSHRDLELLEEKAESLDKRQKLEEVHKILATTLLDNFLAKNPKNIPKVFQNQFKLVYDQGFTDRPEQFDGSWLGWENQSVEKTVEVAETRRRVEEAEEKEKDSGEDSADEGIEMRSLKTSESSSSSSEDITKGDQKISTKDSGVELCELTDSGDQEKGEEVKEHQNIKHEEKTERIEEKVDIQEEAKEFCVDLEMIDKIMVQYSRISNMDTDEAKVLKIKQCLSHGFYGLALKKLIKITSQKDARLVWNAMFELADTLGWSLISERWRDYYLGKYCVPKRAF